MQRLQQAANFLLIWQFHTFPRSCSFCRANHSDWEREKIDCCLCSQCQHWHKQPDPWDWIAVVNVPHQQMVLHTWYPHLLLTFEPTHHAVVVIKGQHHNKSLIAAFATMNSNTMWLITAYHHKSISLYLFLSLSDHLLAPWMSWWCGERLCYHSTPPCIATQNCEPDSPIIQDFLLKIIMEANGLITLGKEYKIDHISLLTVKKTII
jgi:hypothetical protein